MKSRNPLHEQQLEHLVDQALRELPPCHAPDSLETRVLREIEQRATRDETSAGIARWPWTVRAALLSACALCVPLVWVLVARLREPVAHALSSSGVAAAFNGVRDTGHTLFALGELTVHLMHMIPKDWLLGGLVFTGTVYAVLIALGCFLFNSTLTNFKAHSA